MKILMDNDLNVQVILSDVNQSLMDQKVVATDYYVGDSGTILPEDFGETGAKDPLLASWPFVIGITVVTLAASLGVGILLAKRKIKKGFELYED